MLTFRAKRHEPEAEGFAVFDGERYLGDVSPVYLVGDPAKVPGIHRKRSLLAPEGWVQPGGWIAEAAGASMPISYPNGEPLRWSSRTGAGAALRDLLAG
jgi:hypothetical protein